MGKFIVKVTDPKDSKDYYMLWSMVVDAPTTRGMSLAELREFHRWTATPPPGLNIDEYFEERMERVEEAGCSSFDETLQSLLEFNRAGPDESSLDLEGILNKYCREGKSLHEATAGGGSQPEEQPRGQQVRDAGQVKLKEGNEVKEKAQELVSIMKLEEALGSSVDAMFAIHKIDDDVKKVFLEELESAKDGMAKDYSKLFSKMGDGELDEAIRFFGSEAGQAYLSFYRNYAKEMATISDMWGNFLGERVKIRFTQ